MTRGHKITPYQEALEWLSSLSSNLGSAYPGTYVTWDTANVRVICGALWFGTSYAGWGKEEFERFEQECLRLLEVYT